MRYLVGVLAVLLALLFRISAALPAELAEAVLWYDTLEYPSTAERPYVRVVRGPELKGEENPSRRILAEGFLLHEDAESFVVFICGVSGFERPLRLPNPYPALTTRRFVRNPDAAPERRVEYEKLDLKVFAEDVLARAQANAPQEILQWGRPVTYRVEIFAFARACLLRPALQEAATTLLKLASQIPRESNSRVVLQLQDRQPGDDIVAATIERLAPPTFTQILQQELGEAVLTIAESRFADLSLPWEELLKPYEHFETRFPANPRVAYAREAAETLKFMISEDGSDHPKPIEEMTLAEQAAEHIKQLPNMEPCRWVMYEAYPIRAGSSGATDVITPIHRLVDLGDEALPQLIAALNDRRFTRSMFSYIRPSSPKVMRVADIAEGILAHIARLRSGAPRGANTRSAAVYEQLHLLGQLPSVVGNTSGFRRMMSRLNLEVLAEQDAGQIARCYLLMDRFSSWVPGARQLDHTTTDPFWLFTEKLKHLLIADVEEYHKQLEAKYSRETYVAAGAPGLLRELVSFAKENGPKSQAAVDAVEAELARSGSPSGSQYP